MSPFTINTVWVVASNLMLNCSLFRPLASSGFIRYMYIPFLYWPDEDYNFDYVNECFIYICKRSCSSCCLNSNYDIILWSSTYDTFLTNHLIRYLCNNAEVLRLTFRMVNRDVSKLLYNPLWIRYCGTKDGLVKQTLGCEKLVG